MVADLYSGKMTGSAFSTILNFSNLNKGVYFIKLTINNESFTEKIIIQ
jgi:hypothetical protein